MKSDIDGESRFLPIYPMRSKPLLGGSRRNIVITVDTEKLEWRSYTTVKKFEDTFIRFDRIHERDRRTRRTDTV